MGITLPLSSVIPGLMASITATSTTWPRAAAKAAIPSELVKPKATPIANISGRYSMIIAAPAAPMKPGPNRPAAISTAPAGRTTIGTIKALAVRCITSRHFT